MSRILFVIGYIWAIPVTMVAFLAALVGWAKPVRFCKGAVLCVALPGGLWARFFSSRFAASTWGGVVFLARDGFLADEALLTHELRHFWQARLLGPLMPVAYGLCSLWAVVRGGSAYWDNPLERDARRAAVLAFPSTR